MTSESLFGKRYGEVLLIRVGEDGPTATVYNTFPLNDCPADQWERLDAAAVAAENDAVGALLNGPRYWLMSHIEKRGGTDQERRTFGGIEMLRQATVVLSSTNPAPYSVNEVDRKAVFVYDAGQPVFELVDPQGRVWLMQTYSQTVDPTLDLTDLPGLAAHLNLPEGWSYQTRTLDAELRVDTSTTAAHVLQDDQANSYSLLA
ncbi:hypothetical protein [Mycobacterium sp. AT1]|uniref:hypothetical protein n=1 Tax=Mycobacterium sp. AT1 TaxID=1961706 RepID=UPI0009AC0362|nr:hypothetical protein [Mycobacterium sp. AT1]OPX08848.1 hypothetical protein B1790_18115 [Mycobacterium sp. AT1]